ncbi:hypothetical protein AX15_002190 [Amanita polypyramis BW_CC]|nr:hypothetical protein AX15_002190 [Amanita polypyramis BW_CC]
MQLSCTLLSVVFFGTLTVRMLTHLLLFFLLKTSDRARQFNRRRRSTLWNVYITQSCRILPSLRNALLHFSGRELCSFTEFGVQFTDMHSVTPSPTPSAT